MTLPLRDGWRRLAHVLGILVLVAVVGVVVISAVPGVVGMDDSFVVRSDSMSPAIEAGAVVFVSSVPPADIGIGDVITFRRAGADQTITHRIVDVVERDGERQFRTKGDANEEPDSEMVASEQVLGRVAFSIPLVGWLVAFGQSQAGIVLLLFVPAVLLVLNELWGLYRAGSTRSGGGESP